MRQLSIVAATVTALVAASAPLAETKRDLDSHEHGAAVLNVVIDGTALHLEFQSPWANLIGFEHQPSTPEQRSALDDAMALLESPMALFAPNETAGCILDTTDIDSTMSSDSESSMEETVQSDEHDHDHEEKHADSDEHDHDEEHAHDHSEAHSEVIAMYTYQCDDINELTTLGMLALDTWPGIEDLNVQMAGPSGQSAIELNGQLSSIDLSSIR